MSNEKNNRISASLRATREKRKSQVCKVFELKVDISKCSKKTIGDLHRLFSEARWLYNFALSQEDVFSINTTLLDKVTILNKDKVIEERELNVIGSQIKQDVVQGIMNSIRGLSAAKKKGLKVGGLKFKSAYESVNLKQHGTTYRIKEDNKVHVQGIKADLKIRGLKQIDDEYEFANAKLVRRGNDFYLMLTCYKEKVAREKVLNNSAIGIDFGIKTDMTFSDGTKIDTKLPISKRIKKAQKSFSRKKKSSKNRFKAKKKVQKAYDKQTNIKNEIKHKVVNCLNENFGYVAVQDENIKGWHSGLFGKQVQQSAIGGIIADIKRMSHTHVVDRYFPSTKQCPKCKTKNKIGLDERIYHCPNCGYTKDRDIHSAGTIVGESLETYNEITIPTERRNFKPVEKPTPAFLSLAQNCKWVSVKREAPCFSLE